MAFNWPRLEVSHSGKPKFWHHNHWVELLMWSDFCSDGIGWTSGFTALLLSDHLCERWHTDRPKNLTQWFTTILFCSVILTSIFILVFQSKPWWKLKTIVHWPFSATHRRKLNWVQLAGHKGMTCSVRITYGSDRHMLFVIPCRSLTGKSDVLFCLLPPLSVFGVQYLT